MITEETKKPLQKRADYEQINNTTCVYKGQEFWLSAKCKDCVDPAGCKLYFPAGNKKPMKSIYTYEERHRNYWVSKFRRMKG